MEHLRNYPEVLQGEDSKRIVRNYNKVAKVLMEFEVLYHQAWIKQVRVHTLGVATEGSGGWGVFVREQ